MTAIEVPQQPLSRAVALTSTLALVAGFVDVVGFVALFGLFTSHFTGNFVVIGQEIVDHSLRLVAELLALFTFFFVVAGTRLLVLLADRTGHSPFRLCLFIQIALLTGCMLVGVAASPITDPAAVGSIATAQLGVAAMAVQNAICRVIFPTHPPTTVMTMNLTQVSVDFVDMFRGIPGLSDAARDRFDRTAPIVLLFCVGVVLGAFGYLFASFWCLALPIAGLLVLLILAERATAPLFGPPGAGNE
jgi:uncharacterized membrane protein YoaK (UPF0700 family)